MSAWNVECYLWSWKEKSQVENYDFWGQMDIGPNPSSQMQCRASSLLSEPLLFFFIYLFIFYSYFLNFILFLNFT